MEKSPLDVCFVHFVHDRPETTRNGLWQTTVSIPRGTQLTTQVLVIEDHATPQVHDVVRRAGPLAIAQARIPLRSAEHGEQFTAARNQALELIDALGLRPRWVAFMDDDWTFEDRWREHFSECLARDDIISWRAQILFFWDAGMINLGQHHCSPLFFRYQPGDRMKPDQILHVSASVWWDVQKYPMREAILPFYIYDNGTTTPVARQKLFRECAKAGKCDDYTKRYLAEPILMPYEEVLRRWPDPANLGKEN